MRWRLYAYASPFFIFVLAYIAFTARGWLCFLPIIWAYGCIPVLELFLRPDSSNLSAEEEWVVKKNKTFDYLLYAVVPLQYASLIYFLFSLQQADLSWIDITGRIFSMGLLCGIFGINVAHELGHRIKKGEQILAKILLLSSQYLHFFIEHNRGHHKHVGTPADPASANIKESLFFFYPRTIIGSYINAWRIANDDMRQQNRSLLSLRNEMIQYTLIQLIFLTIIFLGFGWWILIAYCIAAGLGIGLLEAVNYIEHYGLKRKEIAPGKFERTMPVHSWNSNHILGRLMLFELSRHSDHHYMAGRKYQTLRHFDSAPQMPTGYPGMMILAHFPPLFFYIMDRQIKKWEALMQ